MKQRGLALLLALALTLALAACGGTEEPADETNDTSPGDHPAGDGGGHLRRGDRRDGHGGGGDPGRGRHDSDHR